MASSLLVEVGTLCALHYLFRSLEVPYHDGEMLFQSWIPSRSSGLAGSRGLQLVDLLRTSIPAGSRLASVTFLSNSNRKDQHRFRSMWQGPVHCADRECKDMGQPLQSVCYLI